MLNRIFDALKTKPALYAPSDAPFWDDDYISKQMLEAHLNPDWDAASRNQAFLRESASWLLSRFKRGGKLLDLGCGPGLYAEILAKAGMRVTGVDISKRSIAYAKELTAGLSADFICGDYITSDFGEDYDAAMIIYDDFGVLSPENRAILLKKTYAALKPGGLFVMDACSMKVMSNYKEGRGAEFCAGGFWRADDYLLVTNNYAYPETANYCDQYAVISRDSAVIYNTWNQAYSRQSLKAELESANFADIEFYANAKGDEYTADSDNICALCAKK